MGKELGPPEHLGVGSVWRATGFLLGDAGQVYAGQVYARQVYAGQVYACESRLLRRLRV